MALSGISIKVATYFAYLCACFKIYISQYFKELLFFCYYYYGTKIIKKYSVENIYAIFLLN